MRIAILGPVMTKAYYGGVATFDEGLAESLIRMGHHTLLFTVQKGEVLNSLLPIKQVSLYQLSPAINSYRPDLVIASLQYAMCFPFIYYGKKVLFLHGFFNFESYGALKTLLSVYATKVMAHHSDYVLANSNFTATINRRIWGIPVNGITYLGLDHKFLENATDSFKETVKKKGQILFVGRLVKSKKVDRMIQALSVLDLRDTTYQFVIAGAGPEYESLKNLAEQKNVKVQFLGKIPHDEIYKLYLESEIFMSLGESEPFGLTFIESLVSNCKIICPNTGGQVEFLTSYADRVKFINPLDIMDIADGLHNLLNLKIEPIDIEKVISRFNYSETAKKIFSIVKEQNGREKIL